MATRIRWAVVSLVFVMMPFSRPSQAQVQVQKPAQVGEASEKSLTPNEAVQNPTEPSEGQPVFSGSDFDRAVQLNGEGEYAEAASLFDQSYQLRPSLSVLLRAAIAWYQAGFYVAASERLSEWMNVVDKNADLLPPEITARKPVVTALLAKMAPKIFSVRIELPEDVYRIREASVKVSVSRLSDGFAPPAKIWIVAPNKEGVAAHEMKLESGRWLFEIQSPIYEGQAEVIEVFDDSPLMLSPIPNAKMPSRSAPMDERIAYREALDQFRAADFRAAVKTITEMVPAGLQTEEAIWLFARSNEYARKWTAALRAYERLLALHPNSLEREKIKTRLNKLKVQSEASKAPITITVDPPTSNLSLVQNGQKTAFVQGQKVYPGTYIVEASWGPETTDELPIQVKAKKQQTFKLSSLRGKAWLRAMRWRVDWLLNLGVASVIGNQSETVSLGNGLSAGAGLQVGWLFSEMLRFDGGLLLQYTNPSFEVSSGSSSGSGAGSWTFYHVALPLGATWISPVKTEVSAGVRTDSLVYASERIFERSVNISGAMRVLNAAPYLGVRQPFEIIGVPMAVDAQYVRQVLPLTAGDSKLRLQQISIGFSSRLF